MSTTPSRPSPRAPFFVIGSPRSGTTLLRLMLTSHPRLVVPPECGFMVWLHPAFGHWGAAEFADPANVSRLAGEVSASRKFETWELDRAEIETAITHRAPRTYGEACDSIYRLFCTHAGKAMATWGDKNNYYLSHIPTLRAIFPQARFIHIVRDGRDVACSYREVMTLDSHSPYRPSLPVAITQIATQWADDIRTIGAQLAAMDGDAAIELRYEDLTADPTRELTRLCDWLGERFDPGMLQFHDGNRAQHLEPAATMDWKQRTLDPVSTQTVGRHALLLAEAEASEFVAIAGSELRRYHYLR